jgi:hypothetical protein
MAWRDMTHPGGQSRTVCSSHYPFWELRRGQWTDWQLWITLQGFKQSHYCINLTWEQWQIIDQPRPKTWHGMIWPTQVDKVELFAHHIIHFKTYAEDNGQTDSCEFLYKASNSLTFASIWLESSGKLLTSQGPKQGGAMVKWPKYVYPLILMKIGWWIENH